MVRKLNLYCPMRLISIPFILSLLLPLISHGSDEQRFAIIKESLEFRFPQLAETLSPQEVREYADVLLAHSNQNTFNYTVSFGSFPVSLFSKQTSMKLTRTPHPALQEKTKSFNGQACEQPPPDSCYQQSFPLFSENDDCEKPENIMIRLREERAQNECMRNACNNDLNGGMVGALCWWLSYSQRDAIYLANFQPEKPRPSNDELKKRFAELFFGDRVVDFPGYHNWRELTYLNRNLFVEAILDWQRHPEGITNSIAFSQFFRGKKSPKERARQFHEALNALKNGWIPTFFVKMGHIPIIGGIPHSRLLTKVDRFKSDPSFMKLFVIDSDSSVSDTDRFVIEDGDGKVDFGRLGSETLSFPNENFQMNRIQEALRLRCKGQPDQPHVFDFMKQQRLLRF